ncbi:MAG: hypothetical protein ACRAVC_05355 [Trichormus sp.]
MGIWGCAIALEVGNLEVWEVRSLYFIGDAINGRFIIDNAQISLMLTLQYSFDVIKTVFILMDLAGIYGNSKSENHTGDSSLWPEAL